MGIDDLIKDFAALPEWDERYAYLIELGRRLPPMAPEKKTDAARVKGCASSVWMDRSRDAEGRNHFIFDSDALIVKGLLYVIYAAVEGKTADEIREIDINGTFGALGLPAHLSAQRLAGLHSVAERIRSPEP
ncbi:MAG: SufE family protein [Rickettsiales bacterium]|jgi:cysteine desulfuration protein SufE|nr:SufE family protein [Rickettsiales bacterium]